MKGIIEIMYFIHLILQTGKPSNRGKVIDPGVRSTWDTTWNQV